ncbi:MAG: mechanosensitive ion channel family protein [Planctomycetota bacterium]
MLAFLLLVICAPYALAADAATEPAGATTQAAAAGPEIDLSEYAPSWAREEVLGVALWQFAAAFVLLLAGFVLKKISDHVFNTVVVRIVKKTRFWFDDLIAEAAGKPFGYLLLLAGLAGAFGVLTLPTEPNVRGFVFGALKVLLAADIMWFLFRLVDASVEHLARLAERTESSLDDQLVPVIRKALKATIGVIFFVWVIQLLGYSISSLIAGLGIGGLAIALALQDTLGNFFGSVFIFLDRPFCVGDWIKLGDVEGIVEQVGFRSTRIRTWPATLVSIPNKTVASATIDNWSRMPKRRVVQTVGVTYKTNADQMEDVVAAIQDIVKNDKGVDPEFIVVRFTDFGESSLNILVYYFTKAIPFADHLATKQRINLAIMRGLEDQGLSIAFPTRTVYLEHQDAEDTLGPALGSGTNN